jgi:glutamate N-acetyltransferase/amino-acid N-acetyltransferase
VAGVFTRSATRSAPVRDCQAKLGSDPSGAAAILVNSGNSNAFTGQRGETSVVEIVSSLAQVTGISTDRIFTASTGVIGEPLPHDRIIAKMQDLHETQDANGIEAAARAIMTTDTFPKGSATSVTIGGKTVNIAGIAKGSGMIAPDMATMLVYIFTDAAYNQAALQALLSRHTDTTFNAITVDSDTSTSDSLILGATGASGVDATGNADFDAALHKVMLDLAHQVVRDGEGASKFVEINVTGAANDNDARVHAMAIANSPLVKTAIAGEDPNWGRIVMAIGKSGAAADRDRLSIRFGDVLVAENGWVSPSYREEDGAAHMKNRDIVIHVDLGLGSGSTTVWTCDLTHGYIEINADYRS